LFVKFVFLVLINFFFIYQQLKLPILFVYNTPRISSNIDHILTNLGIIMPTPMNVYAEIASRYGIEPNSPDEINTFFEYGVYELPMATQKTIAEEILARNGEPEGHITQVSAEEEQAPPT